MHYSYILPMKSPTAARKYSVLVSRHTASAPPSGTGSAVVGAASGIGSASADAPNHGAGASAAGWALGHGTAVGCGWAPGHGAGLSAASWTTGSGTVCHEPPFSRKNKHHVENENEPVHSDISPLLYSYRFYLLRNKYLALESTHL